MHDELDVLFNLSACLLAAVVLGFITQRLKFSPIVGYLLAGVIVGPRTPGLVADQENAAQFAEIGVILLMFGVGLHFDLGELLAVRRLALPGALGQVLVATLLGSVAATGAGWPWQSALIVGFAVSIASTVVLTRVLTDHDLLHSGEGHTAIGWLIVQDILTVFVLVMLPALAAAVQRGAGEVAPVAWSLCLAIVKIVALMIVVLWGGRRLIPRVLEQVARTRTRELFTLAVLALALTIATASAWIFGVSMAMGAFLAGMVVGQSEVSHQAAAEALPMRDAFAVLFFVSVGMLFDPMVAWQNLRLFVALLAVILVASPIVAFAIVWLMGKSVRTALVVAAGIAQIGEFSFILSSLAERHALLAAEGQSLLVACAIVTISLNPLLFGKIGALETWLRLRPRLWKFLVRRAELRARRMSALPAKSQSDEARRPRAIIVGYGPVGRTACSILKEFDLETVIVDLNIDTVSRLAAAGELAIYGDAARRDILEAAGISSAEYLLVTATDPHTRTVIVIVAREINPAIKVYVRAHYLGERAWLEEIGATAVCFEEAETAIGLAALLLREMGAEEDRIRLELERSRSRLA